MRTLTLLLFGILNTLLVTSQTTPQKQVPSQKQAVQKNEIQSAMNETTNGLRKELADLKKQHKETTDPEEKKSLEEQISMLEKQLAMMGGLNKNLSAMSDKTIQKGLEEESGITMPKKDEARIIMLPKKILNDAELLLFIKNIQLGVEKIIPAAEKTEALKIYNETKTQYKSTAIVANAANGCWILGHWEKALFIMGKICVDDLTDADNLNNYAAFLIMTGGEQAALPILEYLNEKYPENSTILNNIGQAWFGLGDIEKAKKNLDETTALYPNHSTANNTLANIYEAEGDDNKAIAFLKSSLQESYDPEKEVQLKRLGYEVKFADLPPLNYPMQDDPFGFIPLINSWDPKKIQSSVDNGNNAFALQRYVNGVKNFKNELIKENVYLDQLIEKRLKKLAEDKSYSHDFLEPYNAPGYLLAGRSLQLYCFEMNGHCSNRILPSSPWILSMLFPLQNPGPPPPKKFITLEQIKDEFDAMWSKEVLQPLAKLGSQFYTNTSIDNCVQYDAITNAYLAKRTQIYENGVKKLQNEFIKKSKTLTEYLKYRVYAAMDDSEYDWDEDEKIFAANSINNQTLFLLSENDKRVGIRRMRNAMYDVILSLLEKADEFQQRYKSNCDKSDSPDPEQAGDDLEPLKVQTLKCEYVKKVKTPVDYEFVLQCNVIKEKKNPKLPKKKPDIQKGSANNASRSNSGHGPIQSLRGPNVVMNGTDRFEAVNQKGPLTSEYKDISQFSLEFNKWGNLAGFNFQLNDDGTALKDPDSIESGIDSRWSWNAIASPKKGFLNKLIIK